MGYYRLILESGDRVVVRDSRSALSLALCAEVGEVTFSGDIDFEGDDAARRGTVTFPKGSIRGIFEPENEDDLVMNDDPATAEIAGKIYNLLDGAFVGTTTVAAAALQDEVAGVRAWH